MTRKNLLDKIKTKRKCLSLDPKQINKAIYKFTKEMQNVSNDYISKTINSIQDNTEIYVTF